MHLGYGKEQGGDTNKELWNYSTNENLIGLDLVGYVKSDWATIRDSAANELRRDSRYNWIRQFDMFCEGMADYSMGVGDIVLVIKGWNSILGIAEVTSNHIYRPELAARRDGKFFDHVRKVKWIKKYGYGKPLEISPIKGFDNTLNIVKLGSKRWSQLVTMEIDR